MPRWFAYTAYVWALCLISFDVFARGGNLPRPISALLGLAMVVGAIVGIVKHPTAVLKVVAIAVGSYFAATYGMGAAVDADWIGQRNEQLFAFLLEMLLFFVVVSLAFKEKTTTSSAQSKD